VADVAAVYAALNGESLHAEADGVTGLRVVPVSHGAWGGQDPAVRSATQAAWSALAGQGAQMVPRELPELAEAEALNAAGRLGEVEVLAKLGAQVQAHWEQLNPVAQSRLTDAGKVTAPAYTVAREGLLALRAALPANWRDVDAVVMATCLHTSMPTEEALPEAKGGARGRTAYGLHTGLASHLDLPSLTVPAGLSPQGLPIGVMVCTLPGREDRLFRIAAALERALSPECRFPDLGWAGER
jgi:Asp-tRNA(Asn)/Glu-tRNA(Gln) amidotransferase A subunit family amidase